MDGWMDGLQKNNHVPTAERSVSCLLSMPCTLPCPFDPGPEVFINWLKPPDDSTFSVHSFYYESDRLGKQKEEYKGRTQLFKDQIPNGNASLLITRVQLTDKGRYKCYTSTDKGNNEDFINLDLEALVNAVSLSEDGETLQCVSTNLLPKLSVSWSPEPEPP
ncbi:hypothetical protein NQD34_014705 [Periophthalmus magnuspinnatus]|nr:hypothetical protein NQD34_014705 [Periophthalmus magnuspinnatus]